MRKSFALACAAITLSFAVSAAYAEDTMMDKDKTMQHHSMTPKTSMKKHSAKHKTMHKDKMMQGDAMKSDTMQK